MEKFKFLPHTADAKFQAFGLTLEEAFSHAALALCSLMWEPSRIDLTQELDIEVTGRDLEQLLMNFLEEILYLYETQNFLLGEVDELKISKRTTDSGYLLRAKFKGDRIKEKDERVFGDVKAITYNEMKIIQESGKVLIQVVVDI